MGALHVLGLNGVRSHILGVLSWHHPQRLAAGAPRSVGCGCRQVMQGVKGLTERLHLHHPHWWQCTCCAAWAIPGCSGSRQSLFAARAPAACHSLRSMSGPRLDPGQVGAPAAWAAWRWITSTGRLWAAGVRRSLAGGPTASEATELATELVRVTAQSAMHLFGPM